MASRLTSLLVVALSFLAAVGASQDHPRHMMTPAMLDRFEAKVTANDPDWLSLKASCDTRVQTTAGTPDSLPPVYASREPITSSPPGYIFADYQGFGYDVGVQLAICYYILNPTDPTQAAKYLAQAKKVALKASAPFAKITPASPPAGWVSRGITSLAAWYISNDGGGGQARVRMNSPGLVNGDTITISGALGCTEANTTARVSEITSTYFDLVQMDGTTPITCASPGTNYNHNFASDAVYPIRTFGPVLAELYDLITDEFSSGEKTQLFETMNTFYDTFRYNSSAYTCRAISNYQAGFFSAAALIGILTRGDGENPRGEEIYDYWRDTYYELKEQPFFARWLGENGGFPEGIRYQPLSVSGIALALLTQWEANGEDLFTDFPWVLGLMQYWVHNTMPPRTYFSYRGFIPSPADGTGTNPQRFRDMSPAFWIVHHIADLKSDAYRPKFKQWIQDMEVTNPNLAGALDKMLYWDSSLSVADWTTETPSLPQLSNPIANSYGRVTMRSDWTTSAVLLDIWTTPGITDFGNGKEKKDKGSLLVQRGDVHLLVSTVAEATRANNTAAYSFFHDRGTANFLDEGFDQGIFYAQRAASPFQATIQNRAGTAAFKQPGWDDCFPGTVVTSNPCRVDRYIDTGEYAYSRSVEIEDVYNHDGGGDTTFFPIKGWDREVFFPRERSGKVFVIYDRTRKTDKVTPSPRAYTQHMSWNLGKAPTISAYASGYRAEVADGGTFKGGVTWLSPSGLTQTSHDLGSYGLVHQVRVRPALATTEYNNWLTVVDAADSSGALEDVALFATHSNVDVVRIGDDTVVGFTNYQIGGVPVFPLTYTMSGMADDVQHYLCGLTPATTYKRTVSGDTVTIATSGGGDDTLSDAAGCIEFATGGGGDPDPPVEITAVSPLPSILVGGSCAQTIGVTGGDGGPYTCALDDGDEPDGCTLNADCTISGTATTAETATFDVVATDGSMSASDPKSFDWVVSANPPIITTTQLPNTVEDAAYSAQVCATGGVPPYTFTSTPDPPCSGLTFTTGSPCATITGASDTVGVCSLNVEVEDDATQTDDVDFTIQTTPTPLSPISVSVRRGSNAAIVTFGGTGLGAGLLCTVDLIEGGVVVQTNEEVLRLAQQRSAFRGLAPSTIYQARATCPGATPSEAVGFTTLATRASGALDFPIKMQAPTFPAGITQVTVNWGLNSPSENTETFACSPECPVELSVAGPDYYLYTYQWKNSGGTVVATSNSKEFIVQ